MKYVPLFYYIYDFALSELFNSESQVNILSTWAIHFIAMKNAQTEVTFTRTSH